MRVYNRGQLAIALATTRFAASFVPNPILATSFSLNLQKASATAGGSPGYSSANTQRAMSSSSKMNQSFETWSYDEPCTTMAWNLLMIRAEAAGLTITFSVESDY